MEFLFKAEVHELVEFFVVQEEVDFLVGGVFGTLVLVSLLDSADSVLVLTSHLLIPALM